MKALLKFDLSKPDEEWDYKVCMQAKDMYFAISDISELLRGLCKYDCAKDLTSKDGMVDIYKLRETIYAILTERDIRTDL